MLRDYQTKAVDDCREAYASGARRVVLVVPTGGGKTVIGCAVVERALAKGKRVLWLAHRRELVDQAARRMTIPCGVVMSGRPATDALVQVASIQTVAAREAYAPADMVVFDECFPAGTMIGDVAIENVRVGDFVPSFDPKSNGVSPQQVVRTFKQRPVNLVLVKTSRATFACTPGHPLFTKAGWRQAGQVGNEEILYVKNEKSAVHGVRTACDSGRQKRTSGLSTRPSLLFERTSRTMGERIELENDVTDKCSAPRDYLREDEDIQSNVLGGVSPKSGGEAEGDGTQTTGTGREWERNDETTGINARRSILDPGVCCPNGSGAPKGHADALQNRSGESALENRDRDRRWISFGDSAQTARFEKSIHSEWVRVESVTVLEPGSDGRFGGLCSDGFVYNLEVELTHTYVANGFVVHNCHHAVAQTYRAVLEQYPAAHVLGLTATPQRGDGTALGDVFDRLVVGPSVRDLVKMGHLVPSVVIAPDRRVGSLAQDPVDVWPQGARGFVFAANIGASRDIADRLREAGVRAAHVDAGTPERVRDEAVQGFRNGLVDVLCSVYVFTEGVDMPEASVCLLARGCGHPGTYLQMVGRVLRPAPGKTQATIIDLRGVSHDHGLPDDPRTYSLDGKPITVVEKLPALSQCDECGAVFRMPPDRTCPRCGRVFPAPKLPEVRARHLWRIESRYDDLRERTADILRPYAGEQAKRDAFDRLLRTQRAKAYKFGWVLHRFLGMFGHMPPKEWNDG